MKKINKIVIISTLLLICSLHICTHQHDEHCGYDSKTNDGCTHQCIFEQFPKVKHDPDEL